jgi:hypothetical protein
MVAIVVSVVMCKSERISKWPTWSAMRPGIVRPRKFTPFNTVREKDCVSEEKPT